MALVIYMRIYSVEVKLHVESEDTFRVGNEVLLCNFLLILF